MLHRFSQSRVGADVAWGMVRPISGPLLNRLGPTPLNARLAFPFEMTSPPSSNTNPPAWIRWFVNDAIRGIVDRSVTAPIGCHFFFDEEENLWEISLFVSRSEVFGGAADGKHVPSGLHIDIAKVCSAFDLPPATFWQAERHSADDDLGSHLSFEGIARGAHVWLRILQQPPEWAGVGRLVHAADGTVEDVW